ncbi:hypothetical protein D6764_01985 [Candidatus Woesearchaeota archaeon]|nr:MAG: hypothetical protein D6764_01985 [Candidatus Woesearchaeota archaeon]
MKTSPAMIGVMACVIVMLLILNYSEQKQLEAAHKEIRQLREEKAGLEEELKVKQTEIKAHIEEIQYLKEKLAEFSAQLRELNNTKTELEKDKETLTEEKTLLKRKLYGIQTDIERTISELEEYEEKIEESMSWFRKNAELSNFKEWTAVRQQIKGWCVERFDDRCEIRLSCLTFVTDYLEEFQYKLDSETTGKADKLQNLSQIYANEGGDCEDYSLLAIAEINELEKYCRDRLLDDVRFVAYVREEGSRHYVEDTKRYYLPDAKSYYLPSEKKNRAIVCGTFPAGYDPNSKTNIGKVGHCVIGFSENTIEKSSDVPAFLKSAVLVEPQNGQYLVDLSRESIFQIPENGEEKEEYNLRLVITENDLYMYDEFDGEMRWHGYSDYIAKIDELKAELEELRQAG